MIETQDATERLKEAVAECERVQGRLHDVGIAVQKAETRLGRFQEEKSGVLMRLAGGTASDKERRAKADAVLVSERDLADARELYAMVQGLVDEAARRKRAAAQAVDSERAAQLRTEARSLLNGAAAQAVRLAQDLEHATAAFNEASRLSTLNGMPYVRGDLREIATKLRIWFDANSQYSVMR